MKGDSKYFSQFENDKSNRFTISSVEKYVMSSEDLEDFIEILKDEPVRKYITEESMTRFGHNTPESLAKDILENSALRWQENSERRFLIRDTAERIVGIAGVNFTGNGTGELWYYKTSRAPSFMFQAISLVLNFLKQEGFKELFAQFELDNVRSTKLLSRLGFHKSGEDRMALTLDSGSHFVH